MVPDQQLARLGDTMTMPSIKTALITGSARGIGRSIALALARDGFSIAIHYRHSAEEAEQIRREVEALGVQAMTFQADVTSVDEAEQLVTAAARSLGGLGVLVNNVGNYVKKTLHELELDDWHNMLNSNLNATYYMCRATLPIMREQQFGRIVNMGFAGATNLVARPNVVAYTIAKTGVVLLTKAIAQTEAEHGITANVVAPGVIETSLSQPLHQIPMARLGPVGDVTAAVQYFVSDASSYITGQTLEVAGGWNL
jgi:3-oxoacyl-[acyl-carrier protein] reductase